MSVFADFMAADIRMHPYAKLASPCKYGLILQSRMILIPDKLLCGELGMRIFLEPFSF